MSAVCKNFSCEPMTSFCSQHGANIKDFFITAAKVVATVALCAYSPYAFGAGLALGVIFHKELAGRINCFVDLWNKNTFIKVGMVGLAVLTFPLTLEFTAAWIGASWPVHLLNK